MYIYLKDTSLILLHSVVVESSFLKEVNEGRQAGS